MFRGTVSKLVASITGFDPPAFKAYAVSLHTYECQATATICKSSCPWAVRQYAQHVRDEHQSRLQGLTCASRPEDNGLRNGTPGRRRHELMLRTLQNFSGEALTRLYLAQEADVQEDALCLFRAYMLRGPGDTLQSYAADTLELLETRIWMRLDILHTYGLGPDPSRLWPDP